MKASAQYGTRSGSHAAYRGIHPTSAAPAVGRGYQAVGAVFLNAETCVSKVSDYVTRRKAAIAPDALTFRNI
jgi:hypothetical protein